ncbi:hypothetical protein ACIBCN_23840 [Nocardia sp. NPDC051052]|uniref:hypothetical protein n=1 Tax=Nocardia sp. NPDC051052 TaxID=3364322 RepID=UPI00378B7B6A
MRSPAIAPQASLSRRSHRFIEEAPHRSDRASPVDRAQHTRMRVGDDSSPVETAVTIYENSRSMTSSSTPEWAWRVAGRAEPAWRLSWLPHRLSHEQARAGMELDELLGRQGLAADPSTQEQADALADILGTTVQQANLLLHQRMHDRRHS